MKRTAKTSSPRRPLTLHRETLRALSGGESTAGAAAGSGYIGCLVVPLVWGMASGDGGQRCPNLTIEALTPAVNPYP